MAKEKRIFNINCKGKEQSFFISKSGDGYIFGIRNPKIGDVHITIIADGLEGFSYHVTDNRKNIEKDKPIRKDIDYEDLVISLLPVILNMTLQEKNTEDRVYVINDFPQILIDDHNDNGSEILEFETPSFIIDMIERMFRTQKNLKEIGINELSIHNWFALLEEDGVLQMVVPSSGEMLFKFDFDDIRDLVDDVVPMIGLEEFMDYIKSDLSR